MEDDIRDHPYARYEQIAEYGYIPAEENSDEEM